jgi:hypothetical protein
MQKNDRRALALGRPLMIDERAVASRHEALLCSRKHLRSLPKGWQ